MSHKLCTKNGSFYEYIFGVDSGCWVWGYIEFEKESWSVSLV